VRRPTHSLNVRRMRIFFVAALLAGLTAGAPAASSAPTAAGAGTVVYAFKARVLKLRYDLEWVVEGGDRYGDCTHWSDDRGVTELKARTLPVRLGGPEGLSGTISIYRSARRDEYSGGVWQWAHGNALGNMLVAHQRRFTHQGGITACGDTPAESDPPRTDDCGRTSYEVPNATMTPNLVMASTYLDDLRTPVTSAVFPRGKAVTAFAISAARQSRSPLWVKCPTTGAAPAFVDTLPVVVRNTDLKGLRALEAGERLVIPSSKTGKCRGDLPDTEVCRYTVSAKLEIRRMPKGKLP